MKKNKINIQDQIQRAVITLIVTLVIWLVIIGLTGTAITPAFIKPIIAYVNHYGSSPLLILFCLSLAVFSFLVVIYNFSDIQSIPLGKFKLKISGTRFEELFKGKSDSGNEEDSAEGRRASQTSSSFTGLVLTYSGLFLVNIALAYLMVAFSSQSTPVRICIEETGDCVGRTIPLEIDQQLTLIAQTQDPELTDLVNLECVWTLDDNQLEVDIQGCQMEISALQSPLEAADLVLVSRPKYRRIETVTVKKLEIELE